VVDGVALMWAALLCVARFRVGGFRGVGVVYCWFWMVWVIFSGFEICFWWGFVFGGGLVLRVASLFCFGCGWCVVVVLWFALLGLLEVFCLVFVGCFFGGVVCLLVMGWEEATPKWLPASNAPANRT